MSDGVARMARDDASLTEEAARKAKRINQEMLQTLVAGLLEDPEADLMALVPPEYEQYFAKNDTEDSDENEVACELSQAALLNRRTLTALLSEFASYPTRDLLDRFPGSYSSKRNKHLEDFVKAKKRRLDPEESSEEDTGPAGGIESAPFFARIEETDATSFGILAPLSPAVEK